MKNHDDPRARAIRTGFIMISQDLAEVTHALGHAAFAVADFRATLELMADEEPRILIDDAPLSPPAEDAS